MVTVSAWAGAAAPAASKAKAQIPNKRLDITLSNTTSTYGSETTQVDRKLVNEVQRRCDSGRKIWANCTHRRIRGSAVRIIQSIVRFKRRSPRIMKYKTK